MTSETTVFEYGTGGSTLFLAKRAFSVESVEDDEAWLGKTQATLDESDLKNVNLHFEPFDFSCLDGFEQSSYISKLSRPHDLIVVDGVWGVVTAPTPRCYHIVDGDQRSVAHTTRRRPAATRTNIPVATRVMAGPEGRLK